jgi:isopenicillin N synthase-like dioxygenase
MYILCKDQPSATADGSDFRTMRDFPVIDISKFADGPQSGKQALAARVDEVCRATGFVAIVGHGVAPELIAEVQTTAKSFFDLPLGEKLAVQMPYPGYPYGYAPFQTEALAGSRGDQTPPDLKESFSIGPPDRTLHDSESAEQEFRFAPNLWPAEPVEFKQVWLSYYRAMSELAAHLMQIFAVALDLPEDFFADKIDEHCSAMRALNYPDDLTTPSPGQLRAGAHTDYGSVTILLSDPDPGGLEIFTPEGEWVAVPSVPGGFVVNIGDLMARWTNDRWVSTLHRVVCPCADEYGTQRRQSVAFFHQPNWDTEIRCLPTCLAAGEEPKYTPVTSGVHLREKFLRGLSINMRPDTQ